MRMKLNFSCLADMEDDNLLLNVISEPIPTKTKLIGKKSIVCLSCVLRDYFSILFFFVL